MDKKDDLIDKIIYIQLYASPNSEELYEYRSSVIYDIQIEDGKEYVFSKYTNNDVCFRILKNKIYTIDNNYYINMPNYKSFYEPKVSKDKYKVIWDNGRNSATYKTLACALSKINFLIEDKYTEVKLEVIEG